MDTPEARENYETFLADDDHDERVVPVSAHAEKALVRAREAGVVEYHPGDDEFVVVGEVSDDQARGLEQVRSFLSEFGGTGVQRVLETALFDELGVVPVFPGAASGAASDDERFRDCFLLPPGSTVEDFAYHVHSDLGEGLLHGIDCRSDRQVGADHELDDRDVLELVTTA
jgi:ribosome-binding ATPase YchF (GTP1/OBG family)